MPTDKLIPIASLQVDTDNARLSETQSSQNAALLALATQQGKYLLELAADIVEHGIDPISRTAVLSAGNGLYTAVEGNRRLTALRALETPAVVAAAYGAADQRRLATLAKAFAQKPITQVACVAFAEEELEECIYWVRARHTGLNEGRGLDPWGAIERDRFLRRHGTPSPEGQVLEFLRTYGSMDVKPSSRGSGFITTLARLLNTPTVRARLGIELRNKRLFTKFPRDEVAKGLRHIVEELQKGKQTSRTLHSAKQRESYAASLPAKALPDPKTLFAASVELGSADVPASAATAAGPDGKTTTPTKKAPKSVSAPTLRKHVVPRGVHLNVAAGRIAAVYGELYRINVSDLPNAAGVLLRVFIEVSVGHYLETHKVMTASDRMSQPLAMRMKAAAAHLVKQGMMSVEVEKQVGLLADGGKKGLMNAALTTFNQYVHSQYTWVRADAVIHAWDDFQPLLLLLWP